jgi:hypothetical protein
LEQSSSRRQFVDCGTKLGSDTSICVPAFQQVQRIAMRFLRFVAGDSLVGRIGIFHRPVRVRGIQHHHCDIQRLDGLIAKLQLFLTRHAGPDADGTASPSGV